MKAFNGAVLAVLTLCLGLSLPADGAVDEAQAEAIKHLREPQRARTPPPRAAAPAGVRAAAARRLARGCVDTWAGGGSGGLGSGSGNSRGGISSRSGGGGGGGESLSCGRAAAQTPERGRDCTPPHRQPKEASKACARARVRDAHA